MPDLTDMNPAQMAAAAALKQVLTCVDLGEHFVLEAGAGAGKTYSLIKVLQHIIERRGRELQRFHQRVACITFTNVANDEIKSRTDQHPVVHSDTIHAFLWSLIRSFQPFLRAELPKLDKWADRLKEVGGIGRRGVEYNLGYPSVESDRVLLHHNDVLHLAVALMKHEKCRALFMQRYPILLIDEYQDTDRLVAEALLTGFLDTNRGPLIGFFGDHWQKIYGTGCGRIEHVGLRVIGKESNFRSVQQIVDVLNRMRPELPQAVSDLNAIGAVTVFHTNGWTGERRPRDRGGHWEGDLTSEMAHGCLTNVRGLLEQSGWDFSPESTKILMLTHTVLAAEQGYPNLARVFPYNDAFIKKEDPHIAFFVDIVEPVCIAFEQSRFGEMFSALGTGSARIHSVAEKREWNRSMERLLSLRVTGSVGDVVEHLREAQRPRLPDAVERREREREKSVLDGTIEDGSPSERLSRLRSVPYREVIALSKFIDGHTPFSTKHGVKGAEFENVLIVLGRGWNQYDFNQMLELAADGGPSAVKREFFERNRNLFYVVCSRPKKRLALLFTQQLSQKAISTIRQWFGAESIQAAPVI